MKSFKHGLLALSLISAPSVFACTMDGKEGIVEKNNLNIPVSVKSRTGVTEEVFNKVVDEASAVMEPLITARGATLKVVKLWEDGTVNAYAEQAGKEWKISMFGGLARHATITADGLALVVCHEIGHHIAGAPVYSWKAGWASTEGQSDYFATTKCLRQVWANDNNESIIASMEVPARVKELCGKENVWNRDYAICVRGAMAGDSVARLFAALRKQEPSKFETPDPKVARVTQENHPATQCRLDTYFQGALCGADEKEEFSRTTEVTGSCHLTLGHKVGMRPLCWHKPAVN